MDYYGVEDIREAEAPRKLIGWGMMAVAIFTSVCIIAIEYYLTRQVDGISMCAVALGTLGCHKGVKVALGRAINTNL